MDTTEQENYNKFDRRNASKKRVDIIAAVRDEANNIPIFVEGISKLNIPESVSLGIIFIEDSSTDNTVEILRSISREYRNIKYYCLKKGFGQGPAIVFGMKRSAGDAVITMDADGGHPLWVIPEMIDFYLKGADIVQGVRSEIKDRMLYRRIGSFLVTRGIKMLTGFNIDEQNVYFRLVSLKYKDAFIRNKRWIYFLRMNFPETAVKRLRKIRFKCEERKIGESKYGLFRLSKLSLYGVLSIISTTRLACFLLFLFGLAIMTILSPLPYFAVVIGFIIALIAGIFYQISFNNILEAIEIKEMYEPG